MKGPILKTIALDSGVSGGFRVVELSAEQNAKRADYLKVLRAAKESDVPSPCFSHYYCRESAMGVGGKVAALAGNIEYGFLQALHGEESAVAALRAIHPRNASGAPILGFEGDKQTTEPQSPCGNCRDIMLEELGPNCEIVQGDPDGEVALIVPMRAYLFEAFQAVDVASVGSSPGDWKRQMQAMFAQGQQLENDAYSPRGIHPRRKYYVRLRTEQGTFYGAHDVMCDYHPVYALRDAIRQARRNNDPLVQDVLIIGEDVRGEPPDVMYKDRQHLLELNLQQELVAGRACNPPVYLATYTKKGGRANPTGKIWKTSVNEWLPFPFTAKNFMDLGIMTQYFREKE